MRRLPLVCGPTKCELARKAAAATPLALVVRSHEFGGMRQNPPLISLAKSSPLRTNRMDESHNDNAEMDSENSRNLALRSSLNHHGRRGSSSLRSSSSNVNNGDTSYSSSLHVSSSESHIPANHHSWPPKRTSLSHRGWFRRGFRDDSNHQGWLRDGFNKKWRRFRKVLRERRRLKVRSNRTGNSTTHLFRHLRHTKSATEITLPPLQSLYERIDDSWQRVIEKRLLPLGQVSFDHCNVRLFHNGDDFFRSLWDDISQSQNEILFETYIMDPDGVALKTLSKLSEAAKRGVAVTLLVDGLGASSMKAEHFAELREVGGVVLEYNRLIPSRRMLVEWPTLSAYRNHKKLVLIDGRVAYTGGMNVSGDHCSTSMPGGNAKMHDLHCRIENGVTSLGFLKEAFAYSLTDIEPQFPRTRLDDEHESDDEEHMEEEEESESGAGSTTVEEDDTDADSEDEYGDYHRRKLGPNRSFRDYTSDFIETVRSQMLMARPYRSAAQSNHDSSSLNPASKAIESIVRVKKAVKDDINDWIHRKGIEIKLHNVRRLEREHREKMQSQPAKEDSSHDQSGNDHSEKKNVNDNISEFTDPDHLLAKYSNADAREDLIQQSWQMKNNDDDDSMVVGESQPCYIQVLESYRDVKLRHIQRALRSAIDNASEYVYVMNPYFLPPPLLRQSLLRAAKRGVDVRIVTCDRSDVPAISLASRHLYADLVGSGLRLYEYSPKVLHAKCVAIDDQFASIGSFNWDDWSHRRNLEMNLVFIDRSFASHLRQRIESDMRDSKEVTAKCIEKRRFWETPVYATAYYISRLFDRWT